MNMFEQLGLESNIVYVKPVAVDQLPSDVQDQLEGETQIFAVHGENGEQVALFTDKNLAFDLAKEYDFRAHSVH